MSLFSLVNWTTGKYNIELGSTMEDMFYINKLVAQNLYFTENNDTSLTQRFDKQQ